MSELIRPNDLNPFFILKYLQPHLLIPDLEVESLNDINFDLLEQMRIKNFILDVDNTLCSYHGTSVDRKIEFVFQRMKRDYNLCILSNTTDERRADLEYYFGVAVVNTNVKKPRRQAFLKALGYLRAVPSVTAMIGDRLFTDITGANYLGIYSIKVNPIDRYSDPPPVKISRNLEEYLLSLYKQMYKYGLDFHPIL